MSKELSNILKPLVQQLVSSKRKSPRRKRKRRRAKVNAMHNIPVGTVSAPSAGNVTNSRIKNFSALIGGEEPLADYTVGWLERCLDPCGEYRTTLDWGKIPDGTLSQSVSGQFREVFTLRAPGTDPMIAPLDGEMWSLYGIHLNSWRNSFFFVADLQRPEVGDAAVRACILEFNNSSGGPESKYPNWHQSSMEGVYWTVVSWSAFNQVPPPNSVGVSPFISQFRITGEGFTMAHNTPSLINQGIVVCAQFNPNNDRLSTNLDSSDGLTSAQWAIMRFGTLGSLVQINWTLPGIGDYPWTGTSSATTPNPVSGAATNTAVLAAPNHTFTFNGSTVYSPGDTLRFQLRRNASNSMIATLQVDVGSTGSFVDSVLATPIGLDSTVTTGTGSGTISSEENHSRQVNIITLPPVTQEDLIQQTPKTVQFLLKDEQGIYVPKRAWQPVYGMTKASNYGPVRMVDYQSSVVGINEAVGTFNDTFDSNFGVSVINITSLPLAAAPYFKVIRSWEAVPSTGSPWGPFTTSCTPKDDMALVVAKTITDLDPFAYPYDYNGLGLLFGKVVSVITKIPKYLRTATNVADCVASAATNVQAAVSRTDASNTRSRVGARRAVVK